MHTVRAVRLLRTVACAATCAVSISACAPTKIIDSLATSTTQPSATTTTTVVPTGTIVELLQQLVDVSTGLGDAIVERNGSLTRDRLARAEAIGRALEPAIRKAGIDLVDDVQRIVGLVRTAVERNRPADADKAMRFAMLVRDAATSLTSQ